MWNVADDNEIKLAIKKIMKMKNRINWIANNGNSTKIFMKGDDMELEKQAKPKDSLIDIMNRRFDSMFKELNGLKKQTNKIDKRLDKTNKKLDKTNKRLDSIDKDLNLIKSLPTIAKELKELK